MRRISSRATLFAVATGLLCGRFVAQSELAFDFPRHPYDLILMGFVTVFTWVSVSLYLVEWVRHMSSIEAPK